MKTTTKHFKLYRDTCSYWLNKFGLFDWDIDFYHTDDKDGCASSCVFNSQAGHAFLRLNKDWGIDFTDKDIKRTALHEVLELLFARYQDSATNRYTTEEVIDTQRHVVIQRLINVLG